MFTVHNETAKRIGADLILHINKRALPINSGSALHAQAMKTGALTQALDLYGSMRHSAGPARRTVRRDRPLASRSFDAGMIDLPLRRTTITAWQPLS